MSPARSHIREPDAQQPRYPRASLSMKARRRRITWGSIALLAVPILVGAGLLLRPVLRTYGVAARLVPRPAWRASWQPIRSATASFGPHRGEFARIEESGARLGPVELVVVKRTFRPIVPPPPDDPRYLNIPW